MKMRISSTRIENYRSIRDLTCEFDSATSIIGPNGAGKSNILRALDWFFNGEREAVGLDDLYKGAPPDAHIRVRVDFDSLTDDDRELLGRRYCPDATITEFTAWKTWTAEGEKISARALAYKPFEQVRSEAKAGEAKSRYNELPEVLGLPSWTNRSAADDAMVKWERENPESLEQAEVSESHFFGINSAGKLSDLFDFVFVSADLRAPEEAADRKDSLLERIIRRAINRDAFDTAVAEIAAGFETEYEKLGREHVGDQLNTIAEGLTAEVTKYMTGASIQLAQEPGVMKAPRSLVAVKVANRGTETPVSHQGHGFQRALLLASLTVLSRHAGEAAKSSSMFLAIEEPELFQHPTQARAFASVLRNLSADTDQRTQVAYATHSPHFVSPEHFDQVRRISSSVDGHSYPESRLTSVTVEHVKSRLDSFVKSEAVARRFEQVCLKHLPDALFAERVILVEGDDDAAIIEGVGKKINDMAVNGICVAPVSGKSGMMIPFAILEGLGIETLMVVDNDSGCADRMFADGKDAASIATAEAAHQRDNQALCRFVDAEASEYPVGKVDDRLVFVPDTLETLLDTDLPGWDLSRQQIINDGRGVEGKHAATYSLAVRECVEPLGKTLEELAHACIGNAA